MNSLQLLFWWNKPAKKGFYPIAWYGICRTYEDAGLNFRDTSYSDHALLAKYVCRLCTVKNSPCDV